MAMKSRDDRINELLGNKLKTPSDLSRVIMLALAEVAGLNSERSNILKRLLANIQGQQLKLAALKLLAVMAASASSVAMNTTPSMAKNLRAALNALTLQVLRQYGIDPRRPNQNKSKTINAIPITRLTGNGTTKIENKTTYNNKTTNEIKIVQPLIPIAAATSGGGLGDNGKLLKNWLNNQFMNQQHDLELTKKDYNRHEINLARSTEKMMRKIEDASKRFAENMNPQKIARASADLMKIVMMTVAAHLIVAGFKPLKEALSGLGGKVGESIRYYLGADKNDKRPIFKILLDGVKDNTEYLINFLKLEFEDRKRAVELVLKRDKSSDLSDFLAKRFDDAKANLKAAAEKYPGMGWAIEGIGGGLIDSLKSFAFSTTSGTSKLGSLMAAGLGGTRGLTNYTYRGLMNSSRNNLTKGVTLNVNYKGETLDGEANSYTVSRNAEDLVRNEVNKETGEVGVKTTNIIASVNSLSKSKSNITHIWTGRAKDNRVVDIKGTVVSGKYLRRILPLEEIRRMTQKGLAYRLFSDSDMTGEIDGFWKNIVAAAGNSVISNTKLLANIVDKSARINYNLLTSDVDGAIAACDEFLPDTYAAYDKVIRNFKTAFLNKKHGKKPKYSAVYRLYKYTNEVFVITDDGWKYIRKLMGVPEGKEDLDILITETTVNNINNLALSALGNNVEKDKARTVTYNETTGKYDSEEFDSLNLYQSEAGRFLDEKDKLHQEWTESQGYRGIARTRDGVIQVADFIKGLAVNAYDFMENLGGNLWDWSKNQLSKGQDITPAKMSSNFKEAGAALIEYFKLNLGLTNDLAAAIVGNLMQESTLNPRAVNPYSGAGGIGLWLGDRADSILKFINRQREKEGLRPVRSILEASLGELALALAWELLTKMPKLLDKIKEAQSLDEANELFHCNFEAGYSPGAYWNYDKLKEYYDKPERSAASHKYGIENIESAGRRLAYAKGFLNSIQPDIQELIGNSISPDELLPLGSSVDLVPYLSTDQILVLPMILNQYRDYGNPVLDTQDNKLPDPNANIELASDTLKKSIINLTTGVPNIINISQGGSSNTTVIANNQNRHKGAIVNLV